MSGSNLLTPDRSSSIDILIGVLLSTNAILLLSKLYFHSTQSTLDFDMSVGEYDDPNDLDMRSIGDEQTAGEGSFPRKYRTHTLRTLLRSPGEENRANRLRKRGNTNRNDDVEAGFENNNRRHSRISVQSPDSRNSPNKTQHRLSYTN